MYQALTNFPTLHAYSGYHWNMTKSASTCEIFLNVKVVDGTVATERLSKPPIQYHVLLLPPRTLRQARLAEEVELTRTAESEDKGKARGAQW